MINTVKTSFFLLLVLVLSACNDSRKLETIRQAEMLMQEQPDSALRVLQTLNRHSLRGETLARYALIYSIAQDKSGLDVTSDSLLRIAHEYYSQHPDDSLYARSQYYMGLYLCLTAQMDSAYSYLLKAKTASEEEKDYYTAYLATDRMRRIAEVSDTALCLSLSKDAYRLYIKYGVNNPVNEALLLRSIGDAYSRRDERDSAIHYYNIAMDKAMLSSNSLVVASVYQNMSRHYCYNGQYEIALKYAHQAFEYTGYIDESLAILMAECYLENSEYDKAQQYLKALSSSNSKENKLVRLSLQHRLSTKIGDADVIQEYFDSACNVAADMYLSTLKEKLELHDKNMHEEMERQRAESRLKLSATCLVFSLLLLTLIVWLFIKYHRAKKAEIEHQKIQNRSLEELNMKEEERFRAEKARLLAEETMLRKEKEQKEQIMERTRFYVKKMVGILRKLEEYRREKALQEKQDKENIPKGKGGKNDKIQMKIDEKDWTELQAYLEACDDSFVTRFKKQFADISKEDYRLCLLLRCGFTNSDLDMVYLNGIQVIKNKQNLAKERLGITGNNLSLRQYITQF